MYRVTVGLILTLALVGTTEAQKDTKYAVTVTIAGTGTCTVTGSPAGISCPGTCSFQFNSGTDVVLTADCQIPPDKNGMLRKNAFNQSNNTKGIERMRWLSFSAVFC